MSLYVLDTDHLSLYRYGHPEVSAHIEATPADQLAVTIITIEEQLRAWYTQIRRARDRDQLARAYQGLFEVAETSKYIRVLPFTSRAIERYLDLRARLPRLGKMDLSIAAIALEYDGIVVTRNRRDFEQVPGLEIQDWSQPENAELR
jgi:tRNA(fMet)-specific endonuclease VapC